MSNDYHYVPCGTCRGAKTIMGMGGMYGDCKTCKGVGEVRQEKKEVRHTFESLNEVRNIMNKYPDEESEPTSIADFKEGGKKYIEKNKDKPFAVPKIPKKILKKIGEEMTKINKSQKGEK